jgi:hypothetical protein
MEIALFSGRTILAVVFVVAAVAKLADRTASRGSLRAFGVPAWLARPGALALPIVELAVAGLLIVAATARYGAAAAVALLVVFSAVLGRELARGTAAGCNCFGALSSTRASSALARNAVLAGAATAVAVVGPGRVFAAPVAAGVVMVAALGWIGWQVLRQQRGPAEPAPAAPALPLDPGDQAPRFALTDPHGTWHTLDDLLVSGRPLVLAFSDPDCAACHELPERLAAWQGARAGEFQFALVTRGEIEGGRFEPVLTQAEHEVAHMYGAWHVPSALVVAPDGRVASPLAVGEGAIERLLKPELEEVVS